MNILFSLIGALGIISYAHAEQIPKQKPQRALANDITDQKNLLGYVGIPKEYHQVFTAYVQHHDKVLMLYGTGEHTEHQNRYVNDASYISSLSTHKTANILVTAERIGAYDQEFEKLLEDYGIPEDKKNEIILYETINKATALDNLSLYAVLLRDDHSFLTIMNLPNGSGYKDGKWVLSEQDAKDNDVTVALAATFKNIYGLR